MGELSFEQNAFNPFPADPNYREGGGGDSTYYILTHIKPEQGQTVYMSKLTNRERESGGKDIIRLSY